MRWGFGSEAAPAEQRYCQHAICRAHAAEDLVFMGRAMKRPDLLELASQTSISTVRCRLQARKGPIRAPLAPSVVRERTKEVALCEIPLPPGRT